VVLFIGWDVFFSTKWSYKLQNIHFGTLYVHTSLNISRLIFFLIFVAEFIDMRRFLYITLILSLLSLMARAQKDPPAETESKIYSQLFYETTPGGEVQVIQEQKLDEILLNFIEQNRKLEGIPCYWIRIYSGSAHNSREEAYETKGRFLRKYEGIRNDVIYDDPNFKVYAGGYRSKSETLKLLNTIKRDFPTAFIVYDIIDFPEKVTDYY
jgi:hypothetical protein